MAGILAVVLAGSCSSALERRVTLLEREVEVLQDELAEANTARVSLAETVRAQGIALENQGPRGERAPRRPRPNPDVAYGVPVDDSPRQGPDDALVTIVVAGEFACPYCDKVRPTLEELRRDYGRELRIVSKSFIVHPLQATAPALAACAAHAQGKYHAMADGIWAKAFPQRDYADATLRGIAQDVGLDLRQYDVDRVSGTCAADVARDRAMFDKLGVSGTPAFFINGRFLSGAQPADAFRSVIDVELAKAKAVIQKGGSRAAYYDDLVDDGPRETAPTP